MRRTDSSRPARGEAGVGSLRGLQSEPALRRWLHLVARFFDVIGARPLTTDEIREVEGLLEAGEAAFFFAQSHADQRHGLETARSVEGSRETKRAALLHDAGKRHARLGPLGRVLATVLQAIGIPLRGRFAQYAGHGELAWRELADIAESDLILGYVRHHHGDRPAGYPDERWSALLRADSARIRNR